MQTSISDIIETQEGTTKILVPKASLTEKVPPKEPAFFNPKAKLNRDLSIIAYSAFVKNFSGPTIFLEGLSGLGARGLRVSNEIKEIQSTIVNDLNPKALELAKKSAELNKLENFETSENEVCRFFADYSKRGRRGSIVDIDPFGSPAKYFDCGLRATMHGGIFSCTATDLQVLNGLFNNACKRRYGGLPIKTEYSNEIAIRLMLGCLRTVSARLDLEIIPLFVECDMHYYRIFVKVKTRPDQSENLGFIFHCKSCGHRSMKKEMLSLCEKCGFKLIVAGPLWIGKIFDKNFVEEMAEQLPLFSVEKKCEKLITKAIAESDLPATFFTLDEIASKMKRAPIKLESAIKKLQEAGYKSSPTSFSPTGFRTEAPIDEITRLFAT